MRKIRKPAKKTKLNNKKTFVFTAPSGAGKTTVVRHLLEEYPYILGFSVSATTRKKRKHERGGKDYYFISKEDFKKSIKNSDFIEWEEVYEDQYYGTLNSEVERLWKKGKTVVFDIDVKGARSIKKYYGDSCLAVFIAPPSLEVLVNRLKNRGTETKKSLKKRIARVKKEMEYRDTFDKVLINDFLPETFRNAEQMVEDFLSLSHNEEE